MTGMMGLVLMIGQCARTGRGVARVSCTGVSRVSRYPVGETAGTKRRMGSADERHERCFSDPGANPLPQGAWSSATELRMAPVRPAEHTQRRLTAVSTNMWVRLLVRKDERNPRMSGMSVTLCGASARAWSKGFAAGTAIDHGSRTRTGAIRASGRQCMRSRLAVGHRARTLLQHRGSRAGIKQQLVRPLGRFGRVGLRPCVREHRGL